MTHIFSLNQQVYHLEIPTLIGYIIEQTIVEDKQWYVINWDSIKQFGIEPENMLIGIYKKPKLYLIK